MLFCNKLQTQLHVFNNCKQTLGRYTWKHGSILFTIAGHWKSKLAKSFSLFFYPPRFGFPLPKELFCGNIPDIILQEGKKLITELTCPAETGLLSPREYKADRYKELKNLSLVPCNALELILLEISALDFVNEHVKHFKNLLN